MHFPIFSFKYQKNGHLQNEIERTLKNLSKMSPCGYITKQVNESSSEEWQKQQLTSLSDLYYNYSHNKSINQFKH